MCAGMPPWHLDSRLRGNDGGIVCLGHARCGMATSPCSIFRNGLNGPVREAGLPMSLYIQPAHGVDSRRNVCRSCPSGRLRLFALVPAGAGIATPREYRHQQKAPADIRRQGSVNGRSRTRLHHGHQVLPRQQEPPAHGVQLPEPVVHWRVSLLQHPTPLILGPFGGSVRMSFTESMAKLTMVISSQSCFPDGSSYSILVVNFNSSG